MTPDAFTITRAQLLRDILTAAVEGGINYWANDRAKDGTLQVERAEYGLDGEGIVRIVFNRYAVQDVSGATTDKGTLVEDEGLLALDPEALNAALVNMHLGAVTYGGQPLGGHLKALARRVLFDNPEDVDYDASDADVLVQAALFGDIVYG